MAAQSSSPPGSIWSGGRTKPPYWSGTSKRPPQPYFCFLPEKLILKEYFDVLVPQLEEEDQPGAQAVVPVGGGAGHGILDHARICRRERHININTFLT